MYTTFDPPDWGVWTVLADEYPLNLGSGDSDMRVYEFD